MKKFIICACALVVLGFSCWYAYYYMGVYLDLDPDAPVTTFMKADESTIYMARDGGFLKHPRRIFHLRVHYYI